ncbi:hypothetical protein Tco_0704681 [Tanacetum coccineum]|uniref:Uncharacterized protein n=1 Tax=Tanacetum coccineum TaxID=301880 RepID=A0ABQ4Y3B3_9ASTR
MVFNPKKDVRYKDGLHRLTFYWLNTEHGIHWNFVKTSEETMVIVNVCVEDRRRIGEDKVKFDVSTYETRVEDNKRISEEKVEFAIVAYKTCVRL